MITRWLRRLRLALLPLPGQAAGLVLLVAVLAAAVVSAPLMIASAEQGAWEQQEERLSPATLGTSIYSSTFTADGRRPVDRLPRLDELDTGVARTAEDAGLNRPLLTTQLRRPVLTPLADGGAGEVELASRTGAEEHLEIVAGAASADGVLIPEELAAGTGAGPGDPLPLATEDRGTTTVTVSGVYVTPVEPIEQWWEAQAYLFVPRYVPQSLELVPPPPAVIAPRDVALGAYEQLGEDVFLEWFLPPTPDVQVEEMRATADRVAELQLRLTNPDSPVAQLVDQWNFANLEPRSGLLPVLDIVDRTVELLEPPVRAVGIGGGAAALVLVGAWAGQRVRRREDEMRALVARGVSPARGALDAARESLLPLLAGLAAGGAAGWLLVRALGPSADLPGSVLAGAALALVAAAAATLAVVGAVTAVLFSRIDAVGRGAAASIAGRVPWLAVTAAVAVVTVVPLVLAEPEEGTGIGVLPLLAPLLVTVVAAGLVTALLPRLGALRAVRRLPAAGFLAARRVLAGQGATRLVVVTTALALGLVVYAGALADSTDRTIAAKASVASGSDVVVPLARLSPGDGPLPEAATLVGAEDTGTLVPGESPADVLVVRPDEIADVVRWNAAFADRPLPELMSALSGYDGARVPVVVAGDLPEGVTDATGGELVLDFRYWSVPVEIVGRASAFPGQRGQDPLFVADWDRFDEALSRVSRQIDLVLAREVWARGDAGEVTRAVVAAGFEQGDDVRTAAEFADRPELDAQTWALSYLRAVALAAGVLGLVGVAMHALAQQRRRTVAALLLTRMGMGRRSADAAGALEIGLLTGLAALVATAVALPASALVLDRLDPVPGLRPDPLFAVPWGSLAAVLAGVLLVTAGGAALVGRTARRSTGGQVMRDAA